MKFAKYGITRAKSLTKTACLQKVKQFKKLANDSKLSPKIRKKAYALAAFYKFKASH